MNDEERTTEEEQEEREEEINIDLNKPMDKISITDKPMAEGRKDKGATISDKDGHSMTTSSIMVGYNKKHLKLPNGDFVSTDELSAAILDSINSVGENKVIKSRKTGQVVDVKDFVDALVSNSRENGYMTIDGSNPKITNQNTYSYSIGEDTSKRVFMAGNKGLQLPNGEYVSIAEIQTAVSEYCFVEKVKKEPVPIPLVNPTIDPNSIYGPSPEPVVPTKTPQPEPKNEVKRVTKKKKKHDLMKIILPIIIAATVALSSLGIETTKVQQYIEKQVTNAGYSFTQMEETALSDLTTGDTAYIEEGTKYFASSDNAEHMEGYQFGNGNTVREAGNYTIDRVSVVDENGILEAAHTPGVNVGEFTEKVAEEAGKSVDEVKTMVHTTDERTGWIDAKDITDAVKEGTTYKGVQENFDGNTITLSNGTVVEVKGSSEGDVLTGSDGEKYRMDQDIDQKQETVSVPNGVEEDKHLTVSFDNMKRHAGVTAGVVGAELLAGMSVAALEDNKRKRYEQVKKDVDDALKQSPVERTIEGASNVPSGRTK